MNRDGHIAAGLEFLATAETLAERGYCRTAGECLWGVICEAANALREHPAIYGSQDNSASTLCAI